MKASQIKEMNKETLNVKNLPLLNGEKILSAIRVAAQKIEILQAVPELCTRILSGDVHLEIILGLECSDVLGELAMLHQSWKNSEAEGQSSSSLSQSLDGKQIDESESQFDGTTTKITATLSMGGSRSKTGSGKGKDRNSIKSERCIAGLTSRPVDEKEDISRQSSGIKKSVEAEKVCKTQSGKGKWDCCSCGMSSSTSKTRLCSCGVRNMERKTKKKIEKAVALLRNDSSQVTFLRDVINASVTNAKSTMTHSHEHSQNIRETNEGRTCAPEESQAEQIVLSEEVSLQQHSMSTPSNNMMQLIRKALQSKYGDHTRRCIKDKDSKALLCILSLIDPEHYFALNPSYSNSNSLKGITNSQCDQSTSRSSHARHNNSNLNAPQHHSNNQQPKHNHPDNLLQEQSTILPTPQHHTRQIQRFKSDEDKTESEKEALPQLQSHSQQFTPDSSTASKKPDKKFNYRKGNEYLTEEMQMNQVLQEGSKRKLWESQSQSIDRVLETIEEIEYHDPDYITNINTLDAVEDSEHQEVKQDCRTTAKGGSSSPAMRIVKIPLSQEDRFNQSINHSSETFCNSDSNSGNNDKYTSQIPRLKKMYEPKYLSEENDNTGRVWNGSKELTGFAYSSKMTTLEDSASSSMSLGLGGSSDESTTTGPFRWSKGFNFGVTNVEESPKRKMMRLFRKLFDLLLFNVTALDIVKDINRRREIKSRKSPKVCSMDNDDQSIISKPTPKMAYSFDDTDSCSEGLIELGKVMAELEKLMRDQLQTTYEEDQKHASYCRELWIKEQRTLRKIETLQEKFNLKVSEWKPKIAIWEDEKRQLHDEFNTINEISLRMVKREIKKGLVSDLEATKTMLTMKEEQSQTLLNMQQEFENLVENNTRIHCKLRAGRNELEMTLENTIAKYDMKMMKRQEMIDSLVEKESSLNVEISKLEQQFSVIDDKYSDMRAAKRLQEIMHGIEISNSFKKSWAAKRIQDAWRRYKLAKLKKKKKKILKKRSSKAAMPK